MPIKHYGFDPRERINRIKAELAKMPTIIANTALNHFLNNFKTESWEGRKWPKRSKMSLVPEGKGLLFGAGNLQRDLTKYVSGNAIRIFVKAPSDKYADIHNDGGTITVRPSAQLIKWCWAMYYKDTSATGKSMYKAMALKLQSGKSFTIKIPQRKYIGHSDKLNKMIIQKGEALLLKIVQ